MNQVLPIPESLEELQRVEHTRLRRRLLYSCHESDLHELLCQELGNVRKSAWGKPDLTANPYLSLFSQLAVLYTESPETLAPAGSEAVSQAVADSGYWSLAQRIQRDTLALREMVVRIDADETGKVTYRPVFPDMAILESASRYPSVPTRIREAVQDPTYGWVWHDLSISDPGNPFYRVLTTDSKDVTESVLGQRFEGSNYPYRDSSNYPILPYVIYHAAESGYLWDPYTLREIVEGSLNIGVLLTFYKHVVKNAAWAQRWVMGAEPVGAEVTELADDGSGIDASRKEVIADPATLLVLRVMEGVTQAQIGQWTSPADPEGILRSISMYERRICLLAGVQPPDVTRQEADVRSGYSLAVARESIREAQKQFEPSFRKADAELLAKTAILLNRATGSNYAEGGYRIRYRGLPKSPQEMQAERDQLVGLIEAGLLDKISAYQALHPDLSRQEAEQALDQISRINRQFSL